jgi:glycosyltransferase involved in cell wall biosynthesis
MDPSQRELLTVTTPAATPRTGLRSLVIVPAFNEERSLPVVLRELSAHAPDVQVLVVDDGSADGTAAVARAGGAVVARLPFNLGVGGALRVGFRYAVRHGFDRAVQVDGDGQHDPSQIDVLLRALDDGADMAVGSRFGSESPYELGRVRLYAMRVLRMLLRALCGQRFEDTSSGFRAFSRPLLEYFATHYPVDYLGDTVEALLLACRGGFRVVEVSVGMRPRYAGTPSSRSLRLIYHYLRVVLAMASTARIRRRSAP